MRTGSTTRSAIGAACASSLCRQPSLTLARLRVGVGAITVLLRFTHLPIQRELLKIRSVHCRRYVVIRRRMLRPQASNWHCLSQESQKRRARDVDLPSEWGRCANVNVPSMKRDRQPLNAAIHLNTRAVFVLDEVVVERVGHVC